MEVFPKQVITSRQISREISEMVSIILKFHTHKKHLLYIQALEMKCQVPLKSSKKCVHVLGPGSKAATYKRR